MPALPDNLRLLESLLQNGAIRLRPGRLLSVKARPKGKALRWDRIEGMMLGIAIGDSLGRPSEAVAPRLRKLFIGDINDYAPSYEFGGEPKGYPSDDTQLSFWTLDQLVADHGLVPEALIRRFARHRIFGIGESVRKALENYRNGVPWELCGPPSPGNGALMRIAPVLIPHLRRGGRALWADTALAAMLTHNDHGSTAACLAFVALLWELLDMESPPPPAWWVDHFAAVMPDLEGPTRYQPRGGAFADYAGPLWRFSCERVRHALDADIPTLDACESWLSGALLIECLPSVLLILARHGHDPREALLHAVNDTYDNDTVAAIVGAAVGALHGREALPERWISGLTGRTRDSDDGRIFAILDQARGAFRKGMPLA